MGMVMGLRTLKGLSIFDYYPEKLIWEPSEQMKQFWKEYGDKQKEKNLC